jgi:predicted ABC-type ATPase
MIVVAGPPGGGKSTLLGRSHFRNRQIPYFNIDERCKEIHGSSQAIPAHVRQRANQELREFCSARFSEGKTFAFETTLRAPFAIEQSGLAAGAGFQTEIHFLAGPVDLHVRRVQARAQQGGHAATPGTLQAMYEASLKNLPKAILSFHRCYLYDASQRPPKLLVEIENGALDLYAHQLPPWMEAALLLAGYEKPGTE